MPELSFVARTVMCTVRAWCTDITKGDLTVRTLHNMTTHGRLEAALLATEAILKDLQAHDLVLIYQKEGERVVIPGPAMEII